MFMVRFSSQVLSSALLSPFRNKTQQKMKQLTEASASVCFRMAAALTTGVSELKCIVKQLLHSPGLPSLPSLPETKKEKLLLVRKQRQTTESRMRGIERASFLFLTVAAFTRRCRAASTIRIHGCKRTQEKGQT